MNDFASANLSPWSIAWLVKEDDWSHLEEVIHYNCTVLGGFHNVIIPISNEGEVLPRFEVFLYLYDPDFIILPPGMIEVPKQLSDKPITAFAIVRWSQISQIIPNSAYSSGSYQAVNVEAFKRTRMEQFGRRDFIAVANQKLPNESRLALVACGDVSTAELDWDSFDGNVYLDAHGYREMILAGVAREGCQSEVMARLGNDDKIVSAPNRFELSRIIKENNHFPLEGATEILYACCAAQCPASSTRLSFIGRTTIHQGIGSSIRRLSHLFEVPAMVILVSDNFEFNEAVLFWDLRANDVITCWLSFAQLRAESSDVCNWLDSDLQGGLYTFGGDVAFAASKADQAKLDYLFLEMSQNRKLQYPEWKKKSYDDVIVYDCERPVIERSHVLITRRANTCSFLPSFPAETLGSLALTLEWPVTTFPRRRGIADLISCEKIQTSPHFYPRSEEAPLPLQSARFRITNSRDVRLQLGDRSPVRFIVPTVIQVVETIFREGGFTKFQESNHSQYQKAFINRAGDLASACDLLRDSPYREFFRLLSNCKADPDLPGWLIKNPMRRSMHQLAICKALRKPILKSDDDSLVSSEALPDDARRLIELELIERGFQLSCASCSAKLWYRAEEVGQGFSCHRCYEKQRLSTNPFWLYRLPEVIFQFFEHDADVPLLALFHLQKKSTQYFQFVLDSELYKGSDDKKGQNIDFACLSDGRVYIGEAKSINNIETKQFRMYQYLADRVSIDGIVFATTAKEWNSSTRKRIEELRTRFHGEVLSLTKAELLDG